MDASGVLPGRSWTRFWVSRRSLRAPCGQRGTAVRHFLRKPLSSSRFSEIVTVFARNFRKRTRFLACVHFSIAIRLAQARPGRFWTLPCRSRTAPGCAPGRTSDASRPPSGQRGTGVRHFWQKPSRSLCFFKNRFDLLWVHLDKGAIFRNYLVVFGACPVFDSE